MDTQTPLPQNINDWRIWRSFIFRISLVVILTGMIAAIVLLVGSSNLVEQSLYLRAKANFKGIVLTRRWNANYGGVFVEKKPGVVSNPYLKNPDITDMNGTVYTKKNPALMTREISELAQADGEYRFHITSLKLINPNNQPDAWEAWALGNFEQGITEELTRETRGKQVYYRYMAPLLVEPSCLTCHADQGYKVGDVRGGISVSFDVTGIDQGKQRNEVETIILVLATLGLVLAGIYFIVRNLYHKLTAARKQLQVQADLDDLTKLYNRRYFFEALELELNRTRRYQNDLSCIMLDLDGFKKVNDTYGHIGGDLVLKGLAQIIRDGIRQSDIAARYGGEEFIILLPQTSIENARLAAEKLCQQVAGMTVESPQGSINVTASFGVASFDLARDDQAVDEMVHRADSAMYQAKASGRNCVRG